MADTTTTRLTLPKEVFNVDVPSHDLLKLAYDSFLANNRLASATTKKRGDVRGGGKKPHAQKGTGRARAGSRRSPLWRGGGVIFGPSGNENYTKKLSTTSKRVAVKQALTLAHQAKKITLVDSFDFPEGKTKETITILDAHKVNPNARVLMVVDTKDDMLIRATSNVQQVLVTKPNYLNVYSILNADVILMSKKCVPIISNWLVKKEEA